MVNLKLEHMYGVQDDDTKFVMWIINQMLNNVKSIDLTKGEQKRDFIYIDDVVEAYLLMLEKCSTFQAFSEFDIGTGNQIRLKEFILKIYQEISNLTPISTQLNFGAKAYRDGEFMEIQENVKPLFDLGWKPKISIENGIRKILKDRIKND